MATFDTAGEQRQKETGADTKRQICPHYRRTYITDNSLNSYSNSEIMKVTKSICLKVIWRWSDVFVVWDVTK